jgi:hypothetical protein
MRFKYYLIKIDTLDLIMRNLLNPIAYKLSSRIVNNTCKFFYCSALFYWNKFNLHLPKQSMQTQTSGLHHLPEKLWIPWRTIVHKINKILSKSKIIFCKNYNKSMDKKIEIKYYYKILV